MSEPVSARSMPTGSPNCSAGMTERERWEVRTVSNGIAHMVVTSEAAAMDAIAACAANSPVGRCPTA